MFDHEAFGAAMGDLIREAVEPLHAKIAQLESQIKAIPSPSEGKSGADGAAGRDGKDCDMEAVKAMVEVAVKAIPVINGKDGASGKDGVNGEHGKSVTIADVQPILDKALDVIRTEADAEVQEAIKAIPAPKDGKDGLNGKDGERGEKGSDGLGLAGAMIDRDGALQITLTNGEVKSLGVVVGKDGTSGKDGIGFDAFELDYLPESHEIAVKASAAGRVKELRYPAGGIRPGNYWREGTKAKAAEAWVHDGSLWIALKETSAKPEASSSDWIIAARRGRDGERGSKGQDGAPPAPIKLKD
jgi:hypothetical protein